MPCVCVRGLCVSAGAVTTLTGASYLFLFVPSFVVSGGGYCSEAISFALSLAPFFGSHMSLSHHGDAYSGKFVSGLDQHTLRTLQPMFHRAQKSGAIAICHSEPGAWDPPRYQTSLCPEPDGRDRRVEELDRVCARRDCL